MTVNEHPASNHPANEPPRGTHTFFCVDGHTCGNPVRLVAGGGPALQGASMSEKRQHFLREFDWIRTALMFEPRGHDMMSGSILYPPTRPAPRASPPPTGSSRRSLRPRASPRRRR